MAEPQDKQITQIGEIEIRELNTLVPYINNPKAHPDGQIEKIMGSFVKFGIDQPIVVDSKGVIIKGHGRYEAAKRLGLKRFPVIQRDDLTEIEAKASRLADNRTAQSDWLPGLLKIELEWLREYNFDLPLTGFDPQEIDNMIEGFFDKEQSWQDEWTGMPEFISEDQRPFKSIIVHFETEEDFNEFARAIGQEISASTRFIFFPKQKRRVFKDQQYQQDGGE